MKEIKKELSAQLSELDKELTDMDHFIEFNKFSASEGYMILKMRKDILEERREVKTQIHLQQIKEGRAARYHPRVLKELFLAKANHKTIYYK